MNLPVPTLRAKCAFLGSSTILLAGLITQRAELVTLAASGLIGLALSFSLTAPLCAQLRSQRLTFRWKGDDGRAGQPSNGTTIFCPNRSVPLECSFSHWGTQTLYLSALRPELSARLRMFDSHSSPPSISLPPGCRTHFTLSVTPKAAGLHVLHGVSAQVHGPLSLFSATLYFPTSYQFKILPRTATRMSRERNLALHRSRANRPPFQRSNAGEEVRELRELQPGDPFKNIAWKASARRGQLLVRTMEQAEHLTKICVIDSSHAMRLPVEARTPLDASIEVSATLASSTLQRGHSMEVLAVDGRIVAESGPITRPNQLGALLRTLLALTQVVDSDLTGLSTSAVKRRVRRHMRVQGVLRSDDRSEANEEDILRLARRQIEHEKDVPSIVAHDRADATLRKYCQSCGIDLPYGKGADPSNKGPGLIAALRKAAGPHRGSRQIIFLSNLAHIRDLQALGNALSRLRARGHRIVVGIPGEGPCESLGRRHAETAGGSAIAPVVDSPTHRVADRVGQRRASEAQHFLARNGIPSTLFTPDESPLAVANRLCALVDRAQPIPRRIFGSPRSQSA